MKRLILISALLFAPLVNAENYKAQKPVICADRKEVIDSLQGEKYREHPMWGGIDGVDGSQHVLLVNHQTGSWTLLQVFPEVACILGVGTDSKLQLNNIGNPT
jgi:hypothetical protein